MTEDMRLMEDKLTLWMAQLDGIMSAEEGRPISACAYGPTDPRGLPWRQGWLEGKAEEAAARRRHPTSLTRGSE